ncbi:MAG: TetR/AcrR family transcriptional regulator [Chloroflexia bacterium]
MALQQVNRNSEDTARSGEVDKKNALIEAACELFTTQGYENTTIAHVAKRAGVAVGTVYLYFKNKSDLLSAVKGGWEQDVLACLLRPDLADMPFQLRARPMIEATFDICARHSNMVQLMGVQPELVGDWKSVASPTIYEVLKAFLAEGIAVGALREVDTSAAAVIVYGMVNGALLQCFVVEDGQNQQQYIDGVVDAIIHYLVSPALL